MLRLSLVPNFQKKKLVRGNYNLIFIKKLIKELPWFFLGSWQADRKRSIKTKNFSAVQWCETWGLLLRNEERRAEQQRHTRPTEQGGTAVLPHPVVWCIRACRDQFAGAPVIPLSALSKYPDMFHIIHSIYLCVKLELISWCILYYWSTKGVVLRLYGFLTFPYI